MNLEVECDPALREVSFWRQKGCTLKRGYLVHYCAVEEVVLLKAGALSLSDKCYCGVLVVEL